MIDSIIARFPEGTINPEILKDVYPHREEGFIGKLDNLHITQFKEAVRVSGSITKYYQGENLSNISRNNYLEAVSKLERVTRLDAHKTNVTAVEFGVTIPVKHPPRDYLAAWGALSRKAKSTFGDGTSVLYSVKRLSFEGYDKIHEMMSKGKYIPDSFQARHALRLEFKIKKGMTAYFGRQISLMDLAEPEINDKLKKDWARFYRSIPKEGVICFDHIPKNPSDFKRILATAGIVRIGNENLKRMIESAKSSGGCSSVQASRMFYQIRDLTHQSSVIIRDDLTQELDEKVREIEEQSW